MNENIHSWLGAQHQYGTIRYETVISFDFFFSSSVPLCVFTFFSGQSRNKKRREERHRLSPGLVRSSVKPFKRFIINQSHPFFFLFLHSTLLTQHDDDLERIFFSSSSTTSYVFFFFVLDGPPATFLQWLLP